MSTASYITTDRVSASLTDTHSHVYVEEFREDLSDMMARAFDAGVETFCMPCIDLVTYQDMMAVADRWPDRCHPMIGLHPTELDDCWKEHLVEMKGLLDADMAGAHRFVGIGETGLDLYWEQDGLERQVASFEQQIEWALEYDLPVVIHSRAAFAELCSVMDHYRETPLRGVFHCFSDGPEEAARLMEYKGFMFGTGGVVTYKKSPLPQALPLIPLDRILTETDCPYLPPVPYRGKRNEPSYIVKVAEKLSEIYGISYEEVCRITVENARRMFRIQ